MPTPQISRRGFIRSALAGAAGVTLSPIVPLVAAEPDAIPAFNPPLGVCAGLNRVGLLKEHGLDYLESSVHGFLVPDQPEATFAERLAEQRKSGFPLPAANGFLPRSLKCTGPAANHDAVLRYTQTALHRAKQAGVKLIVFGSSGSRTPPGDFSLAQAERQFVALLKRMGPLAARHGVTVALEPLSRGETPFINTVAHGARIARTVDHPNIRLVADLYHMACEDEGPASFHGAAELIVHAHLAERQGRTAPGVRGNDFRPYLRALRDINYAGRLSFECRWKDMAAELPVAVRTIKEQLDSL